MDGTEGTTKTSGPRISCALWLCVVTDVPGLELFRLCKTGGSDGRPGGWTRWTTAKAVARNALFLLVTISPWIVFVWLVWPRR